MNKIKTWSANGVTAVFMAITGCTRMELATSYAFFHFMTRSKARAYWLVLTRCRKAA